MRLDAIRQKLRGAVVHQPDVPSNPRVVAEKLLAEVLPPERYLELSAEGHCDIPGKKNKTYRLFRNQKTEIEDKSGNWSSSCIHLSESAPDTDRIVAEYLLITQDEKEYLRTANLTPIGRSPHTREDYGHHGGQAVRQIFAAGTTIRYLSVTSCGVATW